MAALPTSPLSPRAASHTMAPPQASLPPSCAAPSQPSALLERRALTNPTLKSSSFQASLGTHANRSQRTSAFQAGVGTRADRSEGTSAYRAGGVGTIGFNSNKPATLYDVLEVPCTATETEIKTAYRRLAREYHPDRASLTEKEASTTKFLQIHSAYSTLSDPGSRAKYDLQLSLASFQSAGHRNPSPSFTSSNYCSPRTPYSSGRGRSWETDQCWC